MKRIFKPLAIVFTILVAVLVILGVIRAREEVVVTDQPVRDLNVLILTSRGITQRDGTAFEEFSALVGEPSALWTRTLEEAGGKGALPADWPQGFTWPYEFSDALRADAPDVVKRAATNALSSLRADGFFDRLAASRLGPAPILQVQANNGSLFDVLLPELGAIRAVARTNAFRMNLALSNGDEHEFLEAVRDNRFIAQVASQEFLIGVLVGYAVDSLTLQQTRLAIVEHHLSADTLKALDEVVRSCTFRDDMRFALQAERLGQQDMLQRLFTDDGHGNGHISPHPQLGSNFDGSISATPKGALATLASFVIADRKENEAAFDEIRDAAIAQVAKPCVVDVDLELISLPQRYSRYQYPFVHLLAPALGHAVLSTAGVEAEANATRIMIALERFHQNRGSDAATLDALVPELLPAIPPDTISGMPWMYKAFATPDEHGRRYLFYSVGTDKKDNGGVHAIDARVRNSGSEGKDYLMNPPRE